MDDDINVISNNRNFIFIIRSKDDLVSSKFDGNDDGPKNDVPSHVFLVWPNVLDFVNFRGYHTVDLDDVYEKEGQIK